MAIDPPQTTRKRARKPSTRQRERVESGKTVSNKRKKVQARDQTDEVVGEASQRALDALADAAATVSDLIVVPSSPPTQSSPTQRLLGCCSPSGLKPTLYITNSGNVFYDPDASVDLADLPLSALL